jgi:hypothetical protein
MPSGIPVTCEGAPRDLGEAQGKACAGAIRDRFARSGLPFRRTWSLARRFSHGASLGAGMGREIIRHYPHLAERLSGLSRGSGVALETLMDLHVLAGYEPEDAANEVGAALAATSGLAGTLLARSLAVRRDPGSRWIVRRSRPEVGFASLELVQPWHVAGIAGVNEAGLAVTLVHEPGFVASDSDPKRRRRSPPILLVQECLQRFDLLDASLDWCLKRPVRSGATLVITHAGGDVAAVDFKDGVARVARPPGGVLVLGGDAEAAETLRKQLEAGASLDRAGLDRVCGQAAGPVTQVWLNPASRQLWLQGGDGAPRLFDVLMPPGGRRSN